MVKLRIFYVVLGVFIVLWTLCSSLNAAEQHDVSTAPTTNNGEKWRIGYIEGGPYWEYQSTLKAFIHNLAELGWIEKKPIPQGRDEHETQTLWSWLTTDVQSDYLKFVANAYWSAEWDEQSDKRKNIKEDLISRLNTEKDIALMLAFGTWAGLDVANNLHSVPTMVFSSSDPIRAGIVKSAEDSGYDHIHARLDPARYERQIQLFHEIVGFKKLGLVFDDTPTGRTYAALEDVKNVARELGFDVIECPYSVLTSYTVEERNKLLECYQQLAPRIDALYITEQTGVNLENLPMLLEPLFKHKIATFAQGRTFEVKHGVLISMAQQNFQRIGKFHAEIFAQILNGASPRDLPQVFEDPQEIAINLETARRIGFRFPLDILAGAKEIYEHIERVE